MADFTVQVQPAQPAEPAQRVDLMQVVMAAEAQTKKQAHFEAFSGYRRTHDDLTLIANAAYAMRTRYDEAENLYAQWAYAPVPADRARLYLLAGMSTTEAVEHWEPRFAAAKDNDTLTQTTAALETLAALRAPAHVHVRRARGSRA